jgi:hypothetical protein
MEAEEGGQAAPEVPPPRPATERPKVKTPETFEGDRSKLRGWIAQLNIFYRAVGWTDGHDADKIAYASSLLRKDAGIWIIPYVENLQPGWNTWGDFITELRTQFGAVDPRGEARIKLKELKQATRSMTEFWNEFRLIATEAQLDETTMGEWLLSGMKTSLQEAWGNDAADFTTTANLANWAIRKETKLATVKHLQGSGYRKQEFPRKNDGTFRPAARDLSGGEPMDLDATRRRPNLNLSREEYKRRRDNNLCLGCAKSGHIMRNCQNPRNNWAPNRGTGPGRQWKPRTNIREMMVHQEEEEGEKDNGPQ